MASQEVLDDSPENPLYNSKRSILRVSIHCEGCKRKVNKILSQVQGVHDVEVDIRQQKVTVTGDVDADTLLRKLLKSGKHAELWPEIPDQTAKKPAKPARKEKVIPTQQETSQPSVVNAKEVKPSHPVKAEATAPEPPKDNQRGGAGNSNGGEGGGAAKVGDSGKTSTTNTTTPVEDSAANGKVKTGGDNEVPKEQSKSEGKKPEGGSSGAKQPPPVAAEEKGGESERTSPVVVGKAGGGNDGGSGKKKKNKGQNGNKKITEQQSSVAAENGGSRNHEVGTPNSSTVDHHSRPHHPPMYGQYPPQFYGPPGPPLQAPMYATVSYNTAYPSSSYTASYYAPAPPNSYVYSYPGGPEFQAPPPDFDPYSTRQPLDSFEMFSDENPNGCSIM